MDTRDNLLAWLLLEGLLLAPAIGGLLAFLLRMWIIRTFTALPVNVYLTAVSYIYMAAAVSAVLAYGVSDTFHGDFLPGVAYVLAAMFMVFYGGGLAAKEVAEAEQAAEDPFSTIARRSAFDYLRGLLRIDPEDRQALEQRARELRSHGEQLREQAQQYRFSAHWMSRRRRVRVLAYLIIAAGAYIAIRGAMLIHSPWYLASFPTGFSMILYVWLEWRQERMAKRAEGLAQIAASEKLLRELRRLPDTPVPSLRQRLAMLISPGSAIAG
jgi:hypothetical protein